MSQGIGRSETLLSLLLAVLVFGNGPLLSPIWTAQTCPSEGDREGSKESSAETALKEDASECRGRKRLSSGRVQTRRGHDDVSPAFKCSAARHGSLPSPPRNLPLIC